MPVVNLPRSGELWSSPSTGMQFVYVPPGEFEMGSWEPCENPPHRVTISLGFYLGKYPVTQSQWEAVMHANPSHFKGANLPVDSVPWDEAQEFMRRLGDKDAGNRYRLPSEAEWEYAAAAGWKWVEHVDYEWERNAWFSWTAGDVTHPVGELKPNALGLYDMLGNVWEWCQDRYDPEYYTVSPAVDPQGSDDAECFGRVVKGGSWAVEEDVLRPAYRRGCQPGFGDEAMGFRCVREVPLEAGTR
jgi:formylglycine-generating enzyme required for sulfatase activity